MLPVRAKDGATQLGRCWWYLIVLAQPKKHLVGMSIPPPHPPDTWPRGLFYIWTSTAATLPSPRAVWNLNMNQSCWIWPQIRILLLKVLFAFLSVFSWKLCGRFLDKHKYIPVGIFFMVKGNISYLGTNVTRRKYGVVVVRTLTQEGPRNMHIVFLKRFS